MISDALPHPRENPQLFGHESAKQVLLEAFTSGRMHHAWLITGARGLGKATLAYRFARFLLSGEGAQDSAQDGLFGDALPPVQPTSLAVSQNNPVFHRIAAEGHADITVIEPTNLDEDGKEKANYEIRIWQIRKLSKFLRHSAAESNYRIVIIDPADEMNSNAANALLKLLEEPPAGALMLLISHNPGRLLPTIRSRCRVLNLRPLPEPTVAKVLAGFAAPAVQESSFFPETPQVTPETAFAIALAEGSPGLAAEIVAQEGLKLYQQMLDALEELPKLNAIAVQDFASGFNKKAGEAQWQLMGIILNWFIGSTVRGAIEGKQPSEFHPQENIIRTTLIEHCGVDKLAEIWSVASQTVHIGEALNMDRPQTLMEVFSQMQAG